MDQTRDSAVLDNLTKNTLLLESLDPDLPTQKLEEGITYTISKTQENCQLARVFRGTWDPAQGQVLATYLHNRVLPGVGKIGSAFILDSGKESLNEPVSQIAKNLAMHAAAMKPSFTTVDQLPQDVIDQAVTEAKDLAIQNAREDMPEQAK